jgi:hypothetical protein
VYIVDCRVGLHPFPSFSFLKRTIINNILRINRLVDDETINHPWVRAGFLAASTLTVLALVTLRPVRQKAYEWFMVIHFVGAG